MQPAPRTYLLLTLIVLGAASLAPNTAVANGGGIASGNDCNGCHTPAASGTTTATIAFSSPLVAGQPATITVGMTGAPSPLPRGGFNLDMGQGTFASSPGAGALRNPDGSATHSAPSATRTWTLTWTPATAGAASYTLWVNNVNFNGSSSGDRPVASALSSSVTVLRSQGSMCSSDGQCGTGFCTDGRCCDTSCGGTCRACSISAGAPSDGTCANLPPGSLCCTAGRAWNGSSCVVVDACAAMTDTCLDGPPVTATCVDTPGPSAAFTCDCPNAGYSGNGRSPGTGCTDIDECAADPCGPFDSGAGPNGNGCTARAIGSWTPPGYDCTCATGYATDGATCVLQNECTAMTDDCDRPVATCDDPTAAAGDFTCTCAAGYTGTGHLPAGCVDVDECALGMDDCHVNASCSNTPGSFTCACNGGFSGDGRSCADVDECLDPVFLAMCDPSSTCNNLFGTFECNCNAGYRGDGLVSCAEIDECAEGSDDCHADATCTNTPGSWTCACDAGYTGDGRSCADIDECLDPDNVAMCSTVAVCVNVPGDWRCDCTAGFRGDGFTCADIDECAEGTASCHADATCTNGTGDYSCDCNTGYRGSGFDCADIDECTEGTHGCVLNEVCVNQIGAINTCVCRPGYSRDDSGTCVIACGDSMLAPGEACDDGNTEDGDGCDASCAVEPGWLCREPTGEASVCTYTCGDGFVDPGEVCDDGAANSNTTADACREDCTLPRCGDGTTDSGEACDDGDANNDTDPDGCRTTCDAAFCGDGVIDTGERCDPGGGVPGASVAGTCTTMCDDDGGVDEMDPPALTGGACGVSPAGQRAPWALALLGLVAVVTRRRRRRA